MNKKEGSKGRKVAAKEITDTIKLTFDNLNEELKKAGYELIIRKPVTKDLVAFDFGLMFNKGSKEVNIYVDDDLQVVIDHLLETNQQVILKTNWFSPDTVAITVPLEATGNILSDDNTENISG